MKRTLSIILSLCIAATMLFAFTGCSENSRFTGEWTAKIDVSDEMNKSILDDDEDVAKYFETDELTVTLNFTFNDDGTYKIEVDESSVDALCDSFASTVRAGFTAYFTDLLAQQGVDISDYGDIDGALAIIGTSIEEIVKESVNRDDVKKEFEGVNDSGEYKAVKGKLYTFEAGTVPDENVYELYEFNDKDTVVFTGSVGQTDGDDSLTYPITLTRK